MKKEKQNKGILKRAAVLCMAVFFLAKTQVVYANSFSSSKLATGTQNLINDVSAWLLILVPIVGGACAGYFFLRKNAADEQEQHIWDKRIKTTIVCIIGGTIASAMINTITSYYK